NITDCLENERQVSMPTQEERLQTVEYDLKQFKTETIKAYGDMAFEMTIIKGLTENAIGRLSTLSNKTEKHLERVEIRLHAINKQISRSERHILETKTTDKPNNRKQIERLAEAV